MTLVTITPGFHENECLMVANLFWQAFKGKLGPVMAPEHKALAFLTEVVDPQFALSARNSEGTLLGVAGIKTVKGALVGGSLSDMARAYG